MVSLAWTFMSPCVQGYWENAFLVSNNVCAYPCRVYLQYFMEFLSRHCNKDERHGNKEPDFCLGRSKRYPPLKYGTLASGMSFKCLEIEQSSRRNFDLILNIVYFILNCLLCLVGKSTVTDFSRTLTRPVLRSIRSDGAICGLYCWRIVLALSLVVWGTETIPGKYI